jgi:hypothetical protein
MGRSNDLRVHTVEGNVLEQVCAPVDTSVCAD